MSLAELSKTLTLDPTHKKGNKLLKVVEMKVRQAEKRRLKEDAHGE